MKCTVYTKGPVKVSGLMQHINCDWNNDIHAELYMLMLSFKCQLFKRVNETKQIQTWELMVARAECFWNQTNASEEPICRAKWGKTNLVFEETNEYKAWVNISHFEVFLLNIERLIYPNLLLKKSHIYWWYSLEYFMQYWGSLLC